MGVQTDGQQLDEDFKVQIESLKQILIDKDIQLEASQQKVERDQNHFHGELQKKDEVILCLTRELRFNQTIQESLELQQKAADKAGNMSNQSNHVSDDKTDVSVGAGAQGQNDNAEERSRKNKRNPKVHGCGIPINNKGQRAEKNNKIKVKPEVVVDEIDVVSRKDSMVSFKDSTVSKAFGAQSKKSVVMEPPSFCQDIIGQQVTALQQRQTFGKIPDDMKKCFQPESAGLPQLKKLGNTDED